MMHTATLDIDMDSHTAELNALGYRVSGKVALVLVSIAFSHRTTLSTSGTSFCVVLVPEVMVMSGWQPTFRGASSAENQHFSSVLRSARPVEISNWESGEVGHDRGWDKNFDADVCINV